MARREEAIKGSITAGKLADFVMLADDPHAVKPDTIKDIPIVRTVVGGITRYEASAGGFAGSNSVRPSGSGG